MDDIMIALLRSSTCTWTQLLYAYHDANRPGLMDDRRNNTYMCIKARAGQVTAADDRSIRGWRKLKG